MYLETLPFFFSMYSPLLIKAFLCIIYKSIIIVEVSA